MGRPLVALVNIGMEIFITFMHNITKGFIALRSGESPLLVLGPLLRRLPQKLQAAKCVFFYDTQAL